nr:hypothetical protein [Pandoravirus massiliensis]
MSACRQRSRSDPSDVDNTLVAAVRKKARRTGRAPTGPPSVVAVERLLQRRQWHHSDCMAPMPVAAAIALWHAGADDVSHEGAVADALHAQRVDLAVALLQTTTPLVIAGVARDTDGDAAADASRVCRRLASHLSLVASPRLVWETIRAWEADDDDGASARNEPSVYGDRAGWRFMLRFCFASYLGAMAKSSSPAEMQRVWQAASPTMRAHILALAIKHGDETLRLAERTDCQRAWAAAARATATTGATTRFHSERSKKRTRTAPGLLASMRGAVASARNAALWAIAMRIDSDRKKLTRRAVPSRDPVALGKGKEHK